MRYITDFHIHSKYSRATSKHLDFPHLDAWARIKGIDVLSTGDFTHPKWRAEISEYLEPAEAGLFKLAEKHHLRHPLAEGKFDRPIRFVLGAELSCIYSENGRVYRNHILVIAPTLAAVDSIIHELEQRGCNLKADGRPILGVSASELVKIVMAADSRCMVIPAHIWTPWFSMFGSKSGAQSILEAFGDQAKHIAGIETGLSSDPAMNWRVKELDHIAILSNSDAHSAEKLGREANIFDLPELSYSQLESAIRQNDPKRFKETIEFFPEEGKYHLDGHRECEVMWTPKETIKHKGICTKCGRQVTVGVEHQVEVLANREVGEAIGRIPFRYIVPLAEIISDAYGVAPSSKKVMALYERFVRTFRSEFDILLDEPYDELARVGEPLIVEGIKRVREGRVQRQPGYDGVYGVIRVFTEEERVGKKQKSLF